MATAKKKASAKKISTRKSSSKKASARKASAKKATTKKAPAKKATSTKKAAPAKKAASTRKAVSSKKASRSGNTTTDHDEIRKWVEARGGFPAHVKSTGSKAGDLGVLRIDYPGFSGRDTLERIEWEDWFDAFDRNKLAFLHDTKRNSRFSKLVNR